MYFFRWMRICKGCAKRRKIFTKSFSLFYICSKKNGKSHFTAAIYQKAEILHCVTEFIKHELPQYKRRRHQRRPYCTKRTKIHFFFPLLTFSACICKQVFAVSVHFLFTSLIFLWVCSSFLFMLSMRLWFFVPLQNPTEKRRRRKNMYISNHGSSMWRLANNVSVYWKQIKKRGGRKRKFKILIWKVSLQFS